MNESKGNLEQPNDDQSTVNDAAPSQKLRDQPMIGETEPGTQNPESKEVKREQNLNTE